MEESVEVPVVGGVERKTLLLAGLAVLVVVILVLIYYYMNKSSTSQTSQSSQSGQSGQSTSPYPDGSVVRCAETGAIYKVEGGKLRHYATYDRYAALGTPAFVEVDCKVLSTMQLGQDM